MIATMAMTTTTATTTASTTGSNTSGTSNVRFVLPPVILQRILLPLLLVIVSLLVLPATGTSVTNVINDSHNLVSVTTVASSSDLFDKKEHGQQQRLLLQREQEDRILQQVETDKNSTNTTTGTNSTAGSTNTTIDAIQLTVTEFKSYIDSNFFDLILDVRSEFEWTNTGHIPDATLIENLAIYTVNTTDTFALYDNVLQSNCRSTNCIVVVYCNSGRRAADAILILQQYYNWKTTQFYNGLGISQWLAAGYELVNTSSITTPYCSLPTNITNMTMGVCPRKNDSTTGTGSNTTTSTDSTTDRCNPNITSTTKERCIPTNDTNATTTTAGSGSTGSSSSTVLNPINGMNSIYSILSTTSIISSSVSLAIIYITLI